jgi:hypothetical protein
MAVTVSAACELRPLSYKAHQPSPCAPVLLPVPYFRALRPPLLCNATAAQVRADLWSPVRPSIRRPGVLPEQVATTARSASTSRVPPPAACPRRWSTPSSVSLHQEQNQTPSLNPTAPVRPRLWLEYPHDSLVLESLLHMPHASLYLPRTPAIWSARTTKCCQSEPATASCLHRIRPPPSTSASGETSCVTPSLSSLSFPSHGCLFPTRTTPIAAGQRACVRWFMAFRKKSSPP